MNSTSRRFGLAAGAVSVANMVSTTIAATAPIAIPLYSSAAYAQPANGSGDGSAAGKARFAAGVALFREADYRGALVEFRRAYELSNNYRTLFNIGQTEFELQDYAGALRSFEKYLREGGSEIEPERRSAVEADIKKLQGRVAKLEIKSNTAGAEVTVDDVVVGVTPLAGPLVVSAGRRKVTVRKGAQLPVTQLVDIAGGDSTKVNLDLAVVAPQPSATPSAAPRTAPSHTGLWVSLTATGVLTAGALVTGVLAYQSKNDTNEKLSRRGVSASEVESAHAKTGSLALATDVAGGAAIVMGVVSIIVGTSGGATRTDAGRSTGLSIGPRGAFFDGTF